MSKLQEEIVYYLQWSIEGAESNAASRIAVESGDVIIKVDPGTAKLILSGVKLSISLYKLISGKDYKDDLDAIKGALDDIKRELSRIDEKLDSITRLIAALSVKIDYKFAEAARRRLVAIINTIADNFEAWSEAGANGQQLAQERLIDLQDAKNNLILYSYASFVTVSIAAAFEANLMVLSRAQKSQIENSFRRTLGYFDDVLDEAKPGSPSNRKEALLAQIAQLEVQHQSVNGEKFSSRVTLDVGSQGKCHDCSAVFEETFVIRGSLVNGYSADGPRYRRISKIRCAWCDPPPFDSFAVDRPMNRALVAPKSDNFSEIMVGEEQIKSASGRVANRVNELNMEVGSYRAWKVELAEVEDLIVHAQELKIEIAALFERLSNEP